jgi:hypothetical protein
MMHLNISNCDKRSYEIMKLLIVGEVQSPKMMSIHYEKPHPHLTMKSDEHFFSLQQIHWLFLNKPNAN